MQKVEISFFSGLKYIVFCLCLSKHLKITKNLMSSFQKLSWLLRLIYNPSCGEVFLAIFWSKIVPNKNIHNLWVTLINQDLILSFTSTVWEWWQKTDRWWYLKALKSKTISLKMKTSTKVRRDVFVLFLFKWEDPLTPTRAPFPGKMCLMCY